MTTIPTFSFPNTDSGVHGDGMEIGTSPLPHVDDVEFDFDDMRDTFAEADRSMHDDVAETNDPMQPGEDHLIQDDEMMEGDNSIQFPENDSADAKMQSHEDTSIQDEDILFDEEEEVEVEKENKDLAAVESPVKNITSATGVGEEKNEIEKNSHDIDILNQSPTKPKISRTISETEHKENTEDDSEHANGAEINEIVAATNIVDFARQPEPADDDQTTGSPLEPSTQPDDHEELAGNKSRSGPNQDSPKIAQDVKPSSDSPSIDPLALEPDVAQIHSIKVNYFDQEMSLFPPKNGEESTTFFIEDVSLAYESFDKLLVACRDVLGTSLGHDDEIVLDIPALGLHICEDSKYAGQLTLAQIVDTYMLLSQNEELSQIEPLYCQLSHRVCLASQVAYLTSSAREGKTYSDIAADYLDTPEPEGEISFVAEEEVGDVTTYHEAAEGQADYEEPDLQDLAGDENSDTEERSPEAIHNPEDHDSEPDLQFNADTEPMFEDPEKVQKTTNTANSSNQDQPQPEMTEEAVIADSKSNASSHTVENTEHTGDDQDTTSFAENDQDDFDFVEEEYLEFSDDETPAESDQQKSPNVPSPSAVEDNETLESRHDLPAIAHTEGEVPGGDELGTEDFVFDTELGEENPKSLREPPSGTQPVTPSKSVNGKRKVLEDDDDLLIDISTPEPKRTRAS